MPDRMDDGSDWPKISIVTPSYNQGEFVEETIRSILLQGYPNLEYIVIDGGSQDESAEVIRKYESWLAYWVSERDRGQSHAINKGWERATGTILAWLNSDDWFDQGVLPTVSNIFSGLPQESAGLTGSCRWWRGARSEVRRPDLETHHLLGRVVTHHQQQPSTFLKKSIIEEVGMVDPDCHLKMDKDLWLRIQAAGYDLTIVPDVFSNFRCHEGSKTGAEHQAQLHNLKLSKETFRVGRKMWGKPSEIRYWLRAWQALSTLALSYKATARAVWLREKGLVRLYSLRYWATAVLLDPRLLWR